MPLSEADFRRPKNAAALVRAIRGLTSPATMPWSTPALPLKS